MELVARIRRRELTSVELVEAALARTARLNPALNAVCTSAAEQALDAAARADEQTKRAQPVGPLHGLPITVKDSLQTSGLRSTGGAAELAQHVPSADAPSVAALRAAGAIVVGKTNVPAWSADMQTHNATFGLTCNPWNVARTVGGSSGGSAAAVAAGLSAIDLATDIGGSNGLSAGFCGVFGHRPTHGLISTLGVLDSPIGPSTGESAAATIGALARDARDLRLVFDALLGAPAQPAEYWKLQLPETDLADGLRGLRVGVWTEDAALASDPATASVFADLAERMAAAGAIVDREARPFERLTPWLRLALLHAVTSTATTVTGLRMHEEVLAVGGVRGADVVQTLSYREWQQSQRALVEMRNRWVDVFSRVDVMVCPAAACPAFPHVLEGTILDRVYTVGEAGWTVADVGGWLAMVAAANLPATTVPVGRTAAGFPVGVQVVAPPYCDRRALAVAEAISAVVGGFVVPPLAR